jgi:hypothetical protein
VVQDAFTGGAQADRLQTENHFTFTEIVSYRAGKHSIRTGINVPDISRRGLDDYTNLVARIRSPCCKTIRSAGRSHSSNNKVKDVSSSGKR